MSGIISLNPSYTPKLVSRQRGVSFNIAILIFIKDKSFKTIKELYFHWIQLKTILILSVIALAIISHVLA